VLQICSFSAASIAGIMRTHCHVLRARRGGCDYSLVFPRLLRLIRAAAKFSPFSRTDLTSRGFAISLLMARSNASPDSFLAFFSSIKVDIDIEIEAMQFNFAH
jgi:hypothetical protein